MKSTSLAVALALSTCLVPAAHAADAARQAEVARRGGDVMPFRLDATLHVFTKTAWGGVQRVVARDRADAAQVELVRSHLHDIESRFARGDFSGPAHIHGADMPGLARLQAAPAGSIAIRYRDVKGGAQLAYRTADPQLVAALHRWFDAQLSDHGADATTGPMHHHPGMHPN